MQATASNQLATQSVTTTNLGGRMMDPITIAVVLLILI